MENTTGWSSGLKKEGIDCQLAFNDTRKFGRVWVTRTAGRCLELISDPNHWMKALTPDDFHVMLTRRKRLLKPLLLDQTFLAGLGQHLYR